MPNSLIVDALFSCIVEYDKSVFGLVDMRHDALVHPY